MTGVGAPDTARTSTGAHAARMHALSVVIPAHDEARLLGGTLDALQCALRATGLCADVLVVDDASTDATADIARAHGARVLRVDLRHIAAARNAGARDTIAPRLLFLDADTRVGAGVLRAAMHALDAGAVGGGAAVRLDTRPGWLARIGIALSVLLFRTTRIAPGCFVFCTRAAFEAAGGFDERLYAAEDVAISRALRRQGRFVILREAVHTSARKLDTFPLREQAWLALKMALRGPRALRSRDALDLWYGPRRHGR